MKGFIASEAASQTHLPYGREFLTDLLAYKVYPLRCLQFDVQLGSAIDGFVQISTI